MAAIIKANYDTNRTYLRDVIPLGAPYSISLEVTRVCNIRCNYCFQSIDGSKKKELGFEARHIDLKLIETLAEQLKKFPNKIKSMRICGMGEPLANPQFEQIMNILKSSGKVEDISFFTNALLLTHERTQNLLNSGMDRMLISLQGLNAEKYKEVCGADISFEKLINEIKYFYDMSRSTNVKLHIKIADISLKEGEDKKFIDLFGNMADEVFIGTTVPMFKSVEYSNKIMQKSNQYGVEPENEFEVCPQPFYMLHVQANGDVNPCCDYFKPVVGNIIDTSIYDIWNGDRLYEIRRMLLEFKRKAIDYCADCPSKNLIVHHKEEHLDDCANEVLANIKKAKISNV